MSVNVSFAIVSFRCFFHLVSPPSPSPSSSTPSTPSTLSSTLSSTPFLDRFSSFSYHFSPFHHLSFVSMSSLERLSSGNNYIFGLINSNKIKINCGNSIC